MDVVASYRRVLDTPDMINGTPEDMPSSDFAKVVELLTANRLSDCCLRGNEPTAHAEFGRLLQIAAKRRVLVHVETCGLLTSDARQLLEQQPLPVILKLYRPGIYENGQLDEIVKTIRAIHAAHPNRLRVCAVIDDLTHSLDYVDAFAARLDGQSVTFRIVCPKELEELRKFTVALVPAITSLIGRGIRSSLECGLPPCAFTDADFGTLAKLGCLPMKCLPQPGILPDLRIFHCWSLISRATGSLSSFRESAEILNHFIDQFNDIQCDLRAFPDCISCPGRPNEACYGQCLALKAGRVEVEAARLHKIVEENATQETLVQLGICYCKLHKFPEARECLLEARRGDPENIDVHLLLGRVLHRLGDIAGMEEEYEKAARLSGDPAPILVEMGRLLDSAGKSGRARKILARVSQLVKGSAVSE